MEIINISVRDKIATTQGKPVYICGNGVLNEEDEQQESGFVVEFDFDDEWSGFAYKTARFYANGTVYDKMFKGNRCPMPVILDTRHIEVGVFAGNLKTTTPAYLPAKKSILCGGGIPADPSPDVYGQIMEEMNKLNGDIGTAVAEYLKDNPIEGTKFETDETLTLKDGILSVNRAEEVEQDNTLPITSAAVYSTVGNISAILDTI